MPDAKYGDKCKRPTKGRLPLAGHGVLLASGCEDDSTFPAFVHKVNYA